MVWWLVFGLRMKYILANRAEGHDGIVFLKVGLAGIPSASNPPRLYNSLEAADRHAAILNKVLGGTWEPQEAIRILITNFA
jgi:hypothetical protein